MECSYNLAMENGGALSINYLEGSINIKGELNDLIL